MMYSFPAHSGGSTPGVLTIAGSDSGGGAGIQADLKTFTALGCYGASAVTALTAQNTTGVQAVHAVPPSFVEEQLRSVLDDIDVVAIKIGMLANADVVRAVAQTLKTLPSPAPARVIDPVCVSTSGHTLLERDALGVLIEEILPLATVLTPNTREAALLLEYSQRREDVGLGTSPPALATIKDMLRVSRALCALGPRAVLLKGGHVGRDTIRLSDVEAAAAVFEDLRVEYDGLVRRSANMEILCQASVQAQDLARPTDGDDGDGDDDIPVVVDVLYEAHLDDRRGGGSGDGTGCTIFVKPYLDSKSTHGTGFIEAVAFATMYMHHGIATAFPIGSGHGPLNHMHPLLSRALHRPTPNDPYPLVRTLILSNFNMWKQYVQHDFVKQLGKGSLSRERFIHFLKQDYLYLKYYARANGLLVAKSAAYPEFEAAAQKVLGIVEGRNMHVSYCAQWGVGLAELESTPESPACTAYGAYIMDVGYQGDEANILIALAACLLGYGEVGLWLQQEAKQPQSWVRIEGNPYKSWIESYSTESHQAIKVGIERIEALASRNPPTCKKLEQWKEIWGRCTLLEKRFWDMAMDLS